ncbi:DUF1778 domain-containing protein [Rarobacter incanus]|uniref:type II toxin -antitoxin system TacA 1-like antitoxin n=1 Tax=Rarobacter incanus TaxID=153494 RepID=UPI003CCC844A
MRITPEALDTLREAACAQSQDVTSFVLGAALDLARSVLMEDLLLRLSLEERRSTRCRAGGSRADPAGASAALRGAQFALVRASRGA